MSEDDILGRIVGLLASRRTALGRPLLLGITGAVAVGKSTLAADLKARAAAYPSIWHTQIIATDGFLYPNAVLTARGILDRKGFPESYDLARLTGLLDDLRHRRVIKTVPVYSQLDKDVSPVEVSIEPADLTIIEGVNLFFTVPGSPRLRLRDQLDHLLFLDADAATIEQWSITRFSRGRKAARARAATAGSDKPASGYFAGLLDLDEAALAGYAREIWESVNAPLFREWLEPYRHEADLIVRKGPDHFLLSLATSGTFG